jgi:hypothetical protein
MMVGGALLLALAVAACTLPGQDTSTASGSTLALTQVPWCDQPSINFQDDSKLSQPIITDWSKVQGQLGFTPYLPSSMPKGACLDLVGGTIHDPILGAQFRITYILPQSVPLSFSEAPKRGNLSSALQCSHATLPTGATGGTPTAGATTTPGATPTATPQSVTVCLGAISQTSVTLASLQSASGLQTLFQSLQPNVDWVPQGTKQG